jgi:hypothetical protein
MHVRPADRSRAFRKVITLLKPGGCIAITLRRGPVESERGMHDVSQTEIEQLARAHGAFVEIAVDGKDEFGRSDLVGFREGDTLVVVASARAIQNGETDARLLRKLHKKGVQIYDCADLHAKILLLDDVAIISSGNMSLIREEDGRSCINFGPRECRGRRCIAD